jgi:hypothetical protein
MKSILMEKLNQLQIGEKVHISGIGYNHGQITHWKGTITLISKGDFHVQNISD